MNDIWEIKRYDNSMNQEWDNFVIHARNSSFLFMRQYMDYHAHRFDDFSLMAYRRGRLLAILPANRKEDVLQSHGGLTYGGWVLPQSHLDANDVLLLFKSAIDFCRQHSFKTLDYKPIPYIYAQKPSQDDLYALFRLNAKLTQCAVSSTIDLKNRGALNTMQRRHLKRALALNPIIEQCSDIETFYTMLTDCLKERHDVKPVHSVEELTLLINRFPDNIKIYTISTNGIPHAAVCMYLSKTVAHAQYIATTPFGREQNLLTPLFSYLIDLYAQTHQYFDFGISTEDGGQILNTGLLRQKSSYGATATIYQRFELSL